MKTLTTPVTYAVLALVSFALQAQEREAACEPVVVTMRTAFPNYAQERRQHGVAHLAIRLGATGKVVDARIVKSSGHAALDRAAVNSVRTHWRFDVAYCSADDLAQQRSVTVKYERPRGTTVSGTLNRKALSRSRQLHANEHCSASEQTHATTVFTCREPAALGLADATR